MLTSANNPANTADTRWITVRSAIFSRHRGSAPRAAYHAWSAYSSANKRPSSRTAAAATSAHASRRRWVMSDLDALLPEPAFHLAADCSEMLCRARFESHHEHGLGVRCANEAPAVAKENAHSVNVDHFVRGSEVRGRLLHDSELHVVRAVDTNLRRGDKSRDVRH